MSSITCLQRRSNVTRAKWADRRRSQRREHCRPMLARETRLSTSLRLSDEVFLRTRAERSSPQRGAARLRVHGWRLDFGVYSRVTSALVLAVGGCPASRQQRATAAARRAKTFDHGRGVPVLRLPTSSSGRAPHPRALDSCSDRWSAPGDHLVSGWWDVTAVFVALWIPYPRLTESGRVVWQRARFGWEMCHGVAYSWCFISVLRANLTGTGCASSAQENPHRRCIRHDDPPYRTSRHRGRGAVHRESTPRTYTLRERWCCRGDAGANRPKGAGGSGFSGSFVVRVVLSSPGCCGRAGWMTMRRFS